MTDRKGLKSAVDLAMERTTAAEPDGFDRFYGEDPRLAQAANCDMFRAGDAIEMDVDHENELTVEEQMIYDLWDGGPVNPPTYPTS
jgi:hypothetical protein